MTATLDEALAAVDGVDGWMSPDQVAELHRGARTTHPGERIVEIGSFRGRSTIVLAGGAPQGVEVVAIDPHAGNDRGPQEIDGYAAEADDDHERLPRQPGAGRRGRPGPPRAPVQRRRPRRRRRADRGALIDGAHRYAPGAHRHPRLGRAGRRRRHAADPRLVLLGRRHAGHRRVSCSSAAGSATSAGLVRWRCTTPTWTARGGHARATPAASWPSCRGSPATC